LDLGKFLFEKNKKERLARKAQTKIEVKEIQLRPKTNVHHRNIKVNVARKWLDKGMKVRATIRFRGREASYPELALEDLREIAEMLKDISTIEVPPAVEGRNMSMVLIPVKPGKKPASAPAKESEKLETAEKPVEKSVAKIKISKTTPTEKADVRTSAASE
jgi:translation initiation factor IF-3